jgi:hypothetical protein
MKNGPYTLVIAPQEYPGKKYRGRYCYEHRLKFWRANGHLPETVHHDNEMKRDNEDKNLIGMGKAAHNRLHHFKPECRGKFICQWCGEEFTRRLSKGSPNKFCSKPCVWESLRDKDFCSVV